MPYYYECPYCQSNLDPGETCDCQKKQKEVKRENVSDDNNIGVGLESKSDTDAQTTRRIVSFGFYVGRRV